MSIVNDMAKQFIEIERNIINRKQSLCKITHKLGQISFFTFVWSLSYLAFLKNYLSIKYFSLHIAHQIFIHTVLGMSIVIVTILPYINKLNIQYLEKKLNQPLPSIIQ